MYFTLENTSVTDTVLPELVITFGGSYDALRIPLEATGPGISNAVTAAVGTPFRNVSGYTSSPPGRTVIELPPDLVITSQMGLQLEIQGGSADTQLQEIHWLTEDESLPR
jgi:hypothetical protein